MLQNKVKEQDNKLKEKDNEISTLKRQMTQILNFVAQSQPCPATSPVSTIKFPLHLMKILVILTTFKDCM